MPSRECTEACSTMTFPRQSALRNPSLRTWRCTGGAPRRRDKPLWLVAEDLEDREVRVVVALPVGKGKVRWDVVLGVGRPDRAAGGAAAEAVGEVRALGEVPAHQGHLRV